jgi:hypothetical protein
LKKLPVLLILALAAIMFSSCKQEKVTSPQAGLFDSVPVSKPLSPIVNEISGIADSKINPGFLWGHEDSGTPTQIYLINHNGTVSKKIFLKGITNRDWEDMAIAGNEIYIGETGDNALSYNNYKFYRFAEPTAAADTVTAIEVIPFTYPDGPHDAEAFFVDPVSKDIYIITKSDNPSKVYRLSYPFNATNTLSYVTSIPYTGVVSAAISNDGSEILVKTYTSLFYYKRNTGQTIAESLDMLNAKPKYTIEPQGEAICFAADNSGFYTLSEKGFASWVNLYFYKRN